MPKVPSAWYFFLCRFSRSLVSLFHSLHLNVSLELLNKIENQKNKKEFRNFSTQIAKRRRRKQEEIAYNNGDVKFGPELRNLQIMTLFQSNWVCMHCTLNIACKLANRTKKNANAYSKWLDWFSPAVIGRGITQKTHQLR